MNIMKGYENTNNFLFAQILTRDVEKYIPYIIG